MYMYGKHQRHRSGASFQSPTSYSKLARWRSAIVPSLDHLKMKGYPSSFSSLLTCRRGAFWLDRNSRSLLYCFNHRDFLSLEDRALSISETLLPATLIRGAFGACSVAVEFEKTQRSLKWLLHPKIPTL